MFAFLVDNVSARSEPSSGPIYSVQCIASLVEPGDVRQGDVPAPLVSSLFYIGSSGS